MPPAAERRAIRRRRPRRRRLPGGPGELERAARFVNRLRELKSTSNPAPPKPQPITATFEDGVLHPHTQLPLFDGEEVELEIRRKK